MKDLNIDDFNPIELADSDIFREKLSILNRRSCECNFNNLFFWSPVYDQQYLEFEGRLLVCAFAINEAMFPIGPPFSPAELAAVMKKLCCRKQLCGWVYDVPEEYVDENRKALEQYFHIETSEDYYDYIYSAESLTELQGERLNKKRNLIHQFHHEYPNAYSEPLSGQNAAEALRFALAINALISAGTDMLEDEGEALKRALANFDKLTAEGLVLRDSEGKIIAFAMFSQGFSDTADVHFEKADREYKGASQVINQLTAELLHNRGVKYINREQDLGLPGLRQAKHSYEPEFLLKRYRLGLKKKEE
jgi:hypothetical protein